MDALLEAKEAVLCRGADTASSLMRLYRLVQVLRSPGGCPWDGKQTPQSMRPFLLEEAYELVDAVSSRDAPHACEELGDLLFNTFLIAGIYEAAGDFTMADVCNDVADKLVRRHPHVFEGAPMLPGRWDQIKENVEHRADLRKNDSVLDDVPAGFHPLLKAYKYLKKAAKLHFDWPCVEDAKAKVREEYEEFENAVAEGDASHIEEEYGDLLLSMVNVGRSYGIDPSVALEAACVKFYRRFSYVEHQMKAEGVPMEKEHLADMERLWKEAKKQEK